MWLDLNMQFSTNLGIFVMLNIRRKNPFELENTASLSAKSQSPVYSVCFTVFRSFLFKCYFVLLQPFNKASNNYQEWQDFSLFLQEEFYVWNPSSPNKICFHFPFACFPLCRAFPGPSVLPESLLPPCSSLSPCNNAQAINLRPVSLANDPVRSLSDSLGRNSWAG